VLDRYQPLARFVTPRLAHAPDVVTASGRFGDVVYNNYNATEAEA
jgi:hypothetical protein